MQTKKPPKWRFLARQQECDPLPFLYNRDARDTTFRMAKKFEKSILAATRIRMRYLDEWMERLLDYGIDNDFIFYLYHRVLDEFIYLAQNVGQKSFRKDTFLDSINSEMIETAKQYPIDQLIPFVKGKAIAFCHEDKSPSLSHNKKNNRATCFPCSQSFNPIDLLMQRDGLSFIDAVKALN